jgi:malyl-CoA/(S)-citramalyl-CoA lyase
MGFDGKQAIHPGQIAPIQAAFTPSAAEADYAARVVAAMRDAQAAGLGAVSLDGKMLDAANLRMAERILALTQAG